MAKHVRKAIHKTDASLNVAKAIGLPHVQHRSFKAMKANAIAVGKHFQSRIKKLIRADKPEDRKTN